MFKYMIILVTVLIMWSVYTPMAWAKKDCNFDENAPGMKAHMCEVLEAENDMLNNAAQLVENACSGNAGKRCESSMRRLERLKIDALKAHEENDVLEEADYLEMIELSYKGKGKKRDNDEKSCQAKTVDQEELTDFLNNLEVQAANSSCKDCVKYFNSKDQDKAADNKCNNWKLRVIDENGDKAGIINISERQEELCPLECKGKDKLVKEKKARFHDTLQTSIDELVLASEEMENESNRITAIRIAANSVGIGPNDCDEAGTEQPISAFVLGVTFTTVNATEWIAEVCDPPADQTIAGFNASAICLLPVTALQIAKEVYDIMALLNDEFQGEQVTHIQECVELMSTKLDDLGDDIDEIKETVQDILRLILTPQGQRQSGDIDWPNK